MNIKHVLCCPVRSANPMCAGAPTVADRLPVRALSFGRACLLNDIVGSRCLIALLVIRNHVLCLLVL